MRASSEGENVAIEYRWADGRVDRLSVVAAEFVRRQVAVIVAIGGSTPAFSAKAETSTIPIVFTAAQDPVKLGLVASPGKPGGNLTGVFLRPRRRYGELSLLRELVPTAKRISVLLDPANAMDVGAIMKEMETAAARASRAADQDYQRQHAPGDRCGLRRPGTRAPRRAAARPVLDRPARPARILAAFHQIPRPIPGATLSTPAG